MDQEDRDSLEELVGRVKRGDREAIPGLIDMLGGPVYSFLRSKGIPASELPGFVSTFFGALFQYKIVQYRPKKQGGFWSWLCVVMAHSAIDWHRERAARRKREISIEDVEPVRATIGVLPPSSRMKPIIEALQDAMAKLSQEERDLLGLVGVGGVSYEQIVEDAKKRGGASCTVGAFRVRVFRAKQKLAEWMKADPRVPEAFWKANEKGKNNG